MLGEQGEQLASAPTTTPPVKAIAGPMDSVGVQTPTVVTSDISTWNSPSSTGVTSTRTSVTRIEQGVRRDDAGYAHGVPDAKVLYGNPVSQAVPTKRKAPRSWLSQLR